MLQTLIDFDCTYTLDEFLNLDLPGEDDDTIQYELIEGKILATPKSGVSGRHGKIITLIATQLDIFAGISAGTKQKGIVYSGGSTNLGQTGPNASWVEPDVCFVLDGRTPTDFSGPIPVAPDIAIEVWSPSDSTKKIQTKVEAYQRAEVPLIWSVYMENKFILVYTLGSADIKILNLKDELEGGEILPGFKLTVSTLFS